MWNSILDLWIKVGAADGKTASNVSSVMMKVYINIYISVLGLRFVKE